MALGEELKNKGNAFFKSGDGVKAKEAYTQALRKIEDAQCQKVLEELKANAMKLMAVVCANRSAAGLLPGKGQDIETAIIDAKNSLVANASYPKGYVPLTA